MQDTLMIVTSWWPWATTAAVVVGGVWAFRQVTGTLATRPERPTALRLAIGLAALAGIGTLVLVPTSSNPTGGPLILLLILGILCAVIGYVCLSAILGYALLARVHLGTAALAGVIAGPLVLGGSTVLAVTWNRAAASAPIVAPAVQPAKGIDIRAEDVRVTATTYPDPTTGHDLVVIGEVRLTMAVRRDETAGRLSGQDAEPRVAVILRSRGFAMWADHMGGPSPLAAGAEARIPLHFTLPDRHNFDAGEIRSLSEPGTWALELHFVEGGQPYVATAPVMIPVGTSH